MSIYLLCIITNHMISWLLKSNSLFWWLHILYIPHITEHVYAKCNHIHVRDIHNLCMILILPQVLVCTIDIAILLTVWLQSLIIDAWPPHESSMFVHTHYYCWPTCRQTHYLAIQWWEKTMQVCKCKQMYLVQYLSQTGKEFMWNFVYWEINFQAMVNTQSGPHRISGWSQTILSLVHAHKNVCCTSFVWSQKPSAKQLVGKVYVAIFMNYIICHNNIQ